MRGEFGRLQIAAAQILGLKGARILRREKMKAQPAAIGARDALRLCERKRRKEQHEISIDPRLELEIAGEILRSDLAFARAGIGEQRAARG